MNFPLKMLVRFTVFTILIVQSSCSMESGVRSYAWGTGIKVYNTDNAKKLLQTLGYPECRISEPLKIDQVFLLFEKMNSSKRYQSSVLRQDMSVDLKLGYEIRLIDCLFYRHGIPPSGTTIIASIKDGVIVREWLNAVDN